MRWGPTPTRSRSGGRGLTILARAAGALSVASCRDLRAAAPAREFRVDVLLKQPERRSGAPEPLTPHDRRIPLVDQNQLPSRGAIEAIHGGVSLWTKATAGV